MTGMLELRLLRALEAVVDEGTFAGAAARLDYTQSTLSQQIATLESTVGGRVFDRPRGPRRVSLTPLGRVVLQQARELNQRSKQADQAIERFHAGDGRVDIGTFQTVTNVLLPGLVRQLREEHPDCDVRLFEDETPQPPLEGLDLAFFDAAPPPGVDGLLVVEDDHLLLAPPGRFPDVPVDLTEIDGLPIVALPPICDQGRVEEFLAQHGITPQVIFRTADNQGVVSMVRAGLGCAILPALAIAPDLTSLRAGERRTGSAMGDGLALHPLHPQVPRREIHLLWQGTLSPLATRAVTLTTQIARTLESPWVHPA
jgi:DNA-binding transcriptional LysR family regulator